MSSPPASALQAVVVTATRRAVGCYRAPVPNDHRVVSIAASPEPPASIPALEPERSPLRGDKTFLEKYPLILSVGNRNLYYTHSQLRDVTALKKIYPEPLTEIGPETARKFRVKTGEPVIVETNTGQVRMKVLVDDRVAEGVVLVPHGWGGEANGNLLTDHLCREPIMGYPDQKSLQCTIRKAT